MRTRPALTLSSPAINRNVVDFPHPDGPSSTASVPAAASKLTSSTARTAPHVLLTRLTEIADDVTGRSTPPRPARASPE